MKIYMDTCCVNRIFDDLSQPRVKLEYAAIAQILERCRRGEWLVFSGEVIEREFSKFPTRPNVAEIMFRFVARGYVAINGEIERRAAEFQRNGIKEFDALHLASAEECGADIFLTVDDRFLRNAKKINLRTRAENPVIWFMEVTENE